MSGPLRGDKDFGHSDLTQAPNRYFFAKQLVGAKPAELAEWAHEKKIELLANALGRVFRAGEEAGKKGAVADAIREGRMDDPDLLDRWSAPIEETITDENTGNRWDVRENRDVPGSVDLLCVVPGKELWTNRYFRLDCVPLGILRKLLAKAKVVVK